MVVVVQGFGTRVAASLAVGAPHIQNRFPGFDSGPTELGSRILVAETVGTVVEMTSQTKFFTMYFKIVALIQQIF